MHSLLVSIDLHRLCGRIDFLLMTKRGVEFSYLFIFIVITNIHFAETAIDDCMCSFELTTLICVFTKRLTINTFLISNQMLAQKLEMYLEQGRIQEYWGGSKLLIRFKSTRTY